MPLRESAPRVFVSSTISDFADLRSATRYWLEAQGCHVSMSEFTDFERPADYGTLQSCFAVIERCDYFVIFVGGRKGSEYQAGVSVTQQEYRTAVRCRDEGRMTIVPFVRDSVLTAIRERRATKGRGNDAAGVGVAGSVLADAEFVQQFVEEIGQTAVAYQDPSRPTDFLWRYSFTQFADIVDALSIALNLRQPINRLVHLENLRAELIYNLGTFAEPLGDIPYFAPWWMRVVRDRFPIEASRANFTDVVSLGHEDSHRIWNFLLLLPDQRRFVTRALANAIDSGHFLEYDPQRRRPRQGQIQRVMVALKDETDRFVMLAEDSQQRRLELFSRLPDSIRAKTLGYMTQWDLVTLFALSDRLENIMTLAASLLRFIDGKNTDIGFPEILPTSPLNRGGKQAHLEAVAEEHIVAWLQQSLYGVSSDDIDAMRQQLEALRIGEFDDSGK